MEPNGVAATHSVGLGDQARVLAVTFDTKSGLRILFVHVSTQLIRVGAVSLESKSLEETRAEFKKQPRPCDLIFHRRSNKFRHMLSLILKKVHGNHAVPVVHF